MKKKVQSVRKEVWELQLSGARFGVCEAAGCYNITLSNYIESAFTAIDFKDSPRKYNVRAAEMLRYTAPYCLSPVDAEHFILLHREYQPLGFSGCSSHSDYPYLFIRKDDVRLSLLLPELKSQEASGSYWFYDDGSAPWLGRRHLSRYALLLDFLGEPAKVKEHFIRKYAFLPGYAPGNVSSLKVCCTECNKKYPYLDLKINFEAILNNTMYKKIMCGTEGCTGNSLNINPSYV